MCYIIIGKFIGPDKSKGVKMKNMLSSVFLALSVSIFGHVTPVVFAEEEAKLPSITWDQRTIYVNNTAFFIRGIVYTFSDIRDPSKEAMIERLKKDIPLLKGLNVNTVRVFNEIPREALDILYENGIMVIMQIHNNAAYPGPWTKFSSEVEQKEAVRAATEQVGRLKDHPAILMWCAWNDGPFGTKTVETFSREQIESYLRGIVDAVRKEDPTRPVTSANMPGCRYDDLGASFLDVLGFNNYAGLHASGDYTHSVTLHVFDRLTEFGKKYKKPVIITEIGYPSISHPELQGKIIQSLVDAARTRTAGICIFMFADDWGKAGNPDVQDRHIEEYWGIVERDRTPKSGYESLRKAYEQIAKYGPEKAAIEPYIVPSMPNPSSVEKHKMVEDFESKSLPKKKLSGIYSGGPKLTAQISAKKCWTGKKSLNVTYTPSAINGWGCAVINFDKLIPENARGLSLWIYRDGSQNSVIIQLEDKDRDVWKDYSLQLGEPGWAYYVIDFERVKRDPNGSAQNSNGILDKGTICKFIVLFGNVASEISSSIYIDSIEVLY